MDATNEQEETNVNTLIRVSPETRVKLNAIAKSGRWNIRTTVDVLADSYMAAAGIKSPREPRPRRQRATA
jgi:hypothetical protein